jgi:NodT family efflux transporter outer membrane factor (OMF) lipoprotein
MAHQGQLAELKRWWGQHGDPVLVELIDAAQQTSPTLAAARARVIQARANWAASQASMRPSLDASLAASRSHTQPNIPITTGLQGGIQAAWEIDLFGANAAQAAAAQARAAGAQAGWHEARVAVAAEVAQTYISWRHCQAQLALAVGDAASKAASAQLSATAAQAGFTAQSQLELARAVVADAESNRAFAQSQCANLQQALVALTGLPYEQLQSWRVQTPEQASAGYVQFGRSARLPGSGIPAHVLHQRPDLFAEQQNWLAAAAEVEGAQAQRRPRVFLNGNIGALTGNAGGANFDMTTWSVGPLSIAVPLLDGGRREAQRDAATARRNEAEANLRARARQAVREVEESLQTLHANQQRIAQAESALANMRRMQALAQARARSGFGTQSEVLEAERAAAGSYNQWLNFQRERASAWVSLYRAVGGGWEPADSMP